MEEEYLFLHRTSNGIGSSSAFARLSRVAFVTRLGMVFVARLGMAPAVVAVAVLCFLFIAVFVMAFVAVLIMAFFVARYPFGIVFIITVMSAPPCSIMITGGGTTGGRTLARLARVPRPLAALARSGPGLATFATAA